MIPNVGNMSFYMSTMICDFASELLSQFETIVSILYVYIECEQDELRVLFHKI
jgi:hypothetical protein